MSDSNGETEKAESVAPTRGRVQLIVPLICLMAGIFGLLISPLGRLPGWGTLAALIAPAAAITLGFIAHMKQMSDRGMWLTGLILGLVAAALVFAATVWGLSNPGILYLNLIRG